MMYEEFEKLAGYEVSYEDYVNVIEPMYTAVHHQGAVWRQPGGDRSDPGR